MKCKYCGNRLVEGTNTCMYCGKSVVEKPVTNKVISKRERKLLLIKKVLAKVIAVYSIIFGCLGILGVYGITNNILVSQLLTVGITVIGTLIWHYVNKNNLIELPYIIIAFIIYITYIIMSLSLLADPDLVPYFLAFIGIIALPVLCSILYFIYALKYYQYKRYQK